VAGAWAAAETAPACAEATAIDWENAGDETETVPPAAMKTAAHVFDESIESDLLRAPGRTGYVIEKVKAGLPVNTDGSHIDPPRLPARYIRIHNTRSRRCAR
jgi:hypothetical protein